MADFGCGFSRGLEVFFLTCVRGDRARPWFPASGARMPCAPRRYPCEASRTRRAAADNRACGDGVGMEGVRVVVGVDCGCDDDYDRLGCCTHGLKKLRMYTNPPLRSNTLLPSLGLSTGSLGAATPPRTLPPRFRSVCDRRAVPGAPDWGDVEGYPLAGGEDAAALVNGALLGVASRRGAAGGVHPSHTCLCCSPSLPAAWLTAARRAGALRAAPRGPRRRVPPRHASLAVAARGARDASAVDGPAGATRAAEVAMVPPIMSKCAQAPTLQRPVVRTSSMRAFTTALRCQFAKDPRRARWFPANHTRDPRVSGADAIRKALPTIPRESARRKPSLADVPVARSVVAPTACPGRR